MAKTNTRYTYVDFANEVKALANSELKLTAEVTARLVEKADALVATQESKKAYNANNPKKSTAKGASEETKAKAATISAVLPDTESNAKTASEINGLTGEDFTALQVANAIKFIEGAKSCKVIRETVNSKGLKAQKEYTAYFKA